MKFFHKLAFLSFIGIFMISTLLMVSCSKKKDGDTVTESKTIGVLWVGKSGMAKRVFAGMEETLSKKAPNGKIVTKKELADMEAGKKAFQEFENSADGIVFLRSSGAKFFKNYKPKKPSFIGGCNDPVNLGAVKSMEKPGGMVTGVTYALPFAMQISTFKKILPNMKKVCLIVEKGHPGSQIDIEGTKKECQNNGIAYQEIVGDKLESILAQVKAKAGQVDAFIIGQQALVFDNADKIVTASGNKPVLAYNSKCVKLGALAAVAADDKKLGSLLADSIIDVVFKGKSIAEVPVKTDQFPIIHINKGSAKKYGITIPESILSAAEVQ